MPGSMRERQPNVWELRVFLGRDDNGKVRHGYQTFRGGKRAAERELSRLVAAAEDEPVPPPVVDGTPVERADHDQRCHPGVEGQRLGGPLPVDRAALREHVDEARPRVDRERSDWRHSARTTSRSTSVA